MSFCAWLNMPYDFDAVQLKSEGNCNDSWPPRIQDDKITRVDEQGFRNNNNFFLPKSTLKNKRILGSSGKFNGI